MRTREAPLHEPKPASNHPRRRQFDMDLGDVTEVVPHHSALGKSIRIAPSAGEKTDATEGARECTIDPVSGLLRCG